MVVFAAVSDKTYCHQKRRVAVKRCGGILAVALFLGLNAAAQAPKESGWVALFNGKDLTGWKKNGDEKWVVEQGTILCESTANKYGYLTTEKTYKDFTLRLKFKGEAAGNSGVFLRSKILGIDPQHGPDIEGMQVEVDPSVGKHTGGLYESGGRGWVAQPTAEGEQALKSGEWNELEVSVHGAHIVTQLNGTKIVDFNDVTPKFTDGVIGLQIHTGGGVKVRWKDIYLKPE
jgi:3-keto-disaccharide hydrolase